jgi:hypothetical protein
MLLMMVQKRWMDRVRKKGSMSSISLGFGLDGSRSAGAEDLTLLRMDSG